MSREQGGEGLEKGEEERGNGDQGQGAEVCGRWREEYTKEYMVVECQGAVEEWQEKGGQQAKEGVIMVKRYKRRSCGLSLVGRVRR